MGIFSKKKKQKDNNGSLGMRLGFVLLKSDTFDMSAYMERLAAWGIEIKDQTGSIEEAQIVGDVDGMMVSVGFMPGPIPDGEASFAAQNNFMWEDAKAEVDEHKTHVLITCQNDKQNYEESAKVYTALCAAVCEDKDTIGVYMETTVFKADVYVDIAKEAKKEGILPLYDLVFIGLYTSDQGVSAYTSGLKGLDKEELEIVDSKETPRDVLQMISQIVAYVVDYNATLNDGETIGLTEDQFLTITKSKSSIHKEETLKIGF